MCLCFGLGPAPWIFTKLLKTPILYFEADSNQNNRFSARHVADKSDYKWSKNSQGYIDFSIAGSRFCYKSAEICSAAFTKNRLSRVGNRLSENDINTTTGKGKKNKTEMVFTTTTNSSCKKQPLLPVCNVSEPVSYSGTAMVVQKPGDLQWQTYCVSYLRNTNTNRCLQKGLGDILSESGNRASVDSPGVKHSYQCSGVVSHQTSSFNVFENVQSQISPFPSRQYECPFITDENGGYTKQGDDSHFQRGIWEFALFKEIILTAGKHSTVPDLLGQSRFLICCSGVSD